MPIISFDSRPPLTTGGESAVPENPPPPAASPVVGLPNEFLLKALNLPTDRRFILKLDQELTHFIQESNEPTLVFPPMNPYQRRLVHHVADYFTLLHNTEYGQAPSTNDPNGPSSNANGTGGAFSQAYVAVSKMADTAVPDLRLCDLIEEEEPAPKTFKIMKRNVARPGTSSGSNGKGGPKGVASGGSAKERRFMSLQEREAAYERARAEIFQEKSSSPPSSSGATDTVASVPTAPTQAETRPPPARNTRRTDFISPDEFIRNPGLRPSAMPHGGGQIRPAPTYYTNGPGYNPAHVRSRPPPFASPGPGFPYGPYPHLSAPHQNTNRLTPPLHYTAPLPTNAFRPDPRVKYTGEPLLSSTSGFPSLGPGPSPREFPPLSGGGSQSANGATGGGNPGYGPTSSSGRPAVSNPWLVRPTSVATGSTSEPGWNRNWQQPSATPVQPGVRMGGAHATSTHSVGELADSLAQGLGINNSPHVIDALSALHPTPLTDSVSGGPRKPSIQPSKLMFTYEAAIHEGVQKTNAPKEINHILQLTRNDGLPPDSLADALFFTHGTIKRVKLDKRSDDSGPSYAYLIIFKGSTYAQQALEQYREHPEVSLQPYQTDKR
ncbi:hypothetical protein H4R33_005342 [Dimargaris cristalligena]|nr:hypothetical protein H4R33_005342 [Dimargaris cristalligena]